MKRYLKQLTRKCSNSRCSGIFCRMIEDIEMARRVSKALSQYGDVFICKKVDCLDFSDHSSNKNKIIDFYFYALKIIYASEDGKYKKSAINKKKEKVCTNYRRSNTKYSEKTPSLNTCKEKKTLKDCGKNEDCLFLSDSNEFEDLEIKKDRLHENVLEKKLKSARNQNRNAKESHASSDKENDQMLRVSPGHEFNHSFCHVFHDKLTEESIYLSTGLFYLLLCQFQRCNDFNLALIIVRLFIKLSDASSEHPHKIFCGNTLLDEVYFRILGNVYALICAKLTASLVPVLSLGSIQPCCSPLCLFDFNFTKDDFLKSFSVIKDSISNSQMTDIRMDESLCSCFEIFKNLYQINEITRILFDKDFIIKAFFARINIKNELKFSKINFSSCLNYNFAIPLNVKAEILKLHNSEIMKNTLQDAFFRALFEGVTDPYLFISIRREFIYSDTLRFLSSLNDQDLKKQLKVRFLGEEGVDSGGIKKEFFLLLSHEIENDLSTFKQTNNRIWFKKGADQNTLNLIGKIVGIALYNDVVLNLPFPFLIFKKLLNIPLCFEDLEEIEPEVFVSLKNLEKSSAEDLEFLDQTFGIDLDINEVYHSYELLPRGHQIKVNKNNLKIFQKLYAHFLIELSIEDEFNAFRKGFSSIINYGTIQNFKPNELEKLLMGVDDFDFEQIKNTTTYNGFDCDLDVIIRYFWEVFFELTLAKKKKLIQFITGNDRLPVGGSKRLNLTIMRNGCDTERLPSSQTCFNTLLLPEYSSKEKLRSKLEKAINLTAGFFLL